MNTELLNNIFEVFTPFIKPLAIGLAITLSIGILITIIPKIMKRKK